MKMRDLSPKVFKSVRCPRCRVGPGKGCLLLSGGLRNEPHVDRKFAAIKAGEMRRLTIGAAARVKFSSIEMA
jgi:hypothetical protein